MEKRIAGSCDRREVCNAMKSSVTIKLFCFLSFLGRITLIRASMNIGGSWVGKASERASRQFLYNRIELWLEMRSQPNWMWSELIICGRINSGFRTDCICSINQNGLRAIIQSVPAYLPKLMRSVLLGLVTVTRAVSLFFLYRGSRKGNYARKRIRERY